MSRPIKVFGHDAVDIGEGDLFIAKVRHVEGRKVVELAKRDLLDVIKECGGRVEE